MGMLSRALMLPILGPISGVLWIARTVGEHANAERWDEGKIIGALTELELELDLEKMGLEEYELREAALLHQLREIREAKNG
jgi:hypothetical protein